MDAVDGISICVEAVVFMAAVPAVAANDVEGVEVSVRKARGDPA